MLWLLSPTKFSLWSLLIVGVTPAAVRVAYSRCGSPHKGRSRWCGAVRVAGIQTRHGGGFEFHREVSSRRRPRRPSKTRFQRYSTAKIRQAELLTV